ncbi:hypothetical protein FKM82_007980 [Ascaphus truei]
MGRAQRRNAASGENLKVRVIRWLRLGVSTEIPAANRKQTKKTITKAHKVGARRKLKRLNRNTRSNGILLNSYLLRSSQHLRESCSSTRPGVLARP